MSYEEFKESKKSIRYLNGTYKCIVCNKVPAFWKLAIQDIIVLRVKNIQE